MRRFLPAWLAGLLTLALPLSHALPAAALPPAASLRPEMRPLDGTRPAPTRVTVSSQATRLAVARSLRPLTR
ncbi:hypothetical protein, partial [Roseicyclus amphidinii]|uniref:hypothetical protein n=1 Tax=Roseicyclus amphidinii TaxID=3034232 RepID=UPI0024E0F42D